MSSKGWVYVLTNKAYPGLVKIGRTDRSLEDRRDQLSSATGVLHKFVIEYGILLSHGSRDVEAAVHQRLVHARMRKGREFFACTAEDAVVAIRSVANNYPILEQRFDKLDRVKTERLLEEKRVAEAKAAEAERFLRSQESEIIGKRNDYFRQLEKAHPVWIYLAGGCLAAGFALSFLFAKPAFSAVYFWGLMIGILIGIGVRDAVIGGHKRRVEGSFLEVLRQLREGTQKSPHRVALPVFVSKSGTHIRWFFAIGFWFLAIGLAGAIMFAYVWERDHTARQALISPPKLPPVTPTSTSANSPFKNRNAIVSSTPQSTPRPFSDDEGFTQLYGAYNAAAKASYLPNAGQLAKDKGRLHADNYAKDGAFVRPILSQDFSRGGQRFHLLLTFIDPIGPDAPQCHGCGVAIGYGIFEETHGLWKLSGSNRWLRVTGQFGKPPEFEVKPLGRDHSALLESDLAMHQGVFSYSFELDDLSATGLTPIFSTAAEGDDLSVKLSVLSTATNGYADLALQRKHGDSAEETTIYHFKNGRYQESKAKH